MSGVLTEVTVIDQDHIYFIRIEDGFIVYDSALDFKAWLAYKGSTSRERHKMP